MGESGLGNASWLWVMLGGALGAISRHAVQLALAPTVARTGWPWAVLLINVVGSFALGLTLALVARGVWPQWVRLALGTGYLGALTTFSTFSVDLDGLILRGEGGAALLYALLSVGLGLGAALAGRLLAEWLVTAWR